MSITLQLRRNLSPDNALIKDCPVVYTLTGTLRNESSIIDPVILIESSDDIHDINYAYIPEFGRYYFITQIISIRTTLWELHMHVDVLETYNEQIKACDCLVGRSQSNWNMYLHDTNYKCFQDPMIMNYEFPLGFDLSSSSFVLAVVGDSEPVS